MDLDALASQYGGTAEPGASASGASVMPKNLEALAAQYGGTPSGSNSKWAGVQEELNKPGILPSASKLFSATGKFIGSAVGMAGEGLAAAIDPNVRQQMMTMPTDEFKQTFPFLGQFVDQGTNDVSRQMAARGAGTALELSTAASGGAGAASMAPMTKGKLILSGARTGGKFGAAQGLSEAADQPDATLSQIASGGAKGAAGGAALGAFFGAAGATAWLGYDGYKAVSSKLNPTAVDALINGIAPTGKKATAFRGSAQTAMPDLLHTSKQMNIDVAKSDKPFDDLLAVTDQAKKNVWAQYENLKGGYGAATVDGNKVANAMASAIDRRFRLQNPAKAAEIERLANTYRRPIPVDEAEEFLQAANGELNSFYAKNKVGQSVALRDPETAHVVQEAEALRSALYGKLEELTGQDASKIKQRWGALTEVQNQALARKSVLDRAKPMNLSEQLNYPMSVAKGVFSAVRGDAIGAAEGLAQASVAKAMKEAQSNEAMIRKAFSQADKKGLKAYPYVGPPRPMTTNLLPAPSTMMTPVPKTKDPSRVLSQPEARQVLNLDERGKFVQPKMSVEAVESSAKARQQATGKKQSSSQIPMEGLQLMKTKSGVYFVTRSGYTPTRISVQEAMELQKAGYKLKKD